MLKGKVTINQHRPCYRLPLITTTNVPVPCTVPHQTLCSVVHHVVHSWQVPLLSFPAQLSACPNLSCPCALTGPSLEAPLACSSLISCMCCTEHLGCFPLVYGVPAPSAFIFYLLSMSAVEINLPSTTYFNCTISCIFLSDYFYFPMIPSSTVSIGHKSCTSL